MSKTETQLKILKAKCTVKYEFVISHYAVKQSEKDLAKMLANDLTNDASMEEFIMLDQFLTDLLTIITIRQAG